MPSSRAILAGPRPSFASCLTRARSRVGLRPSMNAAATSPKGPYKIDITRLALHGFAAEDNHEHHADEADDPDYVQPAPSNRDLMQHPFKPDDPVASPPRRRWLGPGPQHGSCARRRTGPRVQPAMSGFPTPSRSALQSP
jgi:hypothetical protein